MRSPKSDSRHEVPQRFLQAILHSPAHDAARLIWADALDDSVREADYSRAEFIRLQCALAKLDQDDPRRTTLQARERELQLQHTEAWAGPLLDWVDAVEFRRGLLDGVVMSAAQFLRHSARLDTCPTLRRLRLMKPVGLCSEIAKSRRLARFTELDLCGCELTDRDANLLFRSKHLTQLRCLEISFNSLTDQSIRSLLDSDALPQLERLSLAYNASITSASLTTAWARMERGQVLSLDVSGNAIDEVGLRTWPVRLNCPVPKLSGNPLGDAGVAALARRPHLDLGSSHRLELRQCSLGQETGHLLASAPWFANICRLDLGENSLGNLGIVRLLNGLQTSALQHLSIPRNNISDLGAQTLSEAPLMQQLLSLDVSGNSITQATLDRLWAARGSFLVEIRAENNLGTNQPR